MLKLTLSTLALVLTATAASALTVDCKLVSDPVEAERMSLVSRFVIDSAAQRVDMMIGDEAEWTFRRGGPDLFDKEGDTFAVRRDASGFSGAGMRAGIPHAFTFAAASRAVTWTYVSKDKITQMRWRCS